MKLIFKMLAVITAIIISFILIDRFNQDPSEDEEEEKAAQKPEDSHNPVFSMFINSGKEGYQIYRNGDKFALFNIGRNRRVLGMRCSQGDCYNLISRGEDDSVMTAAAIYKNGKPVMTFDMNFEAVDFAMEDGNFYVLGHFGDTLTTVYKNGARIFNTRYMRNAKRLGVFLQDVFIAEQRENSIAIYKGKEKSFEINGQIVDFRVAHNGAFTLTHENLYCDGEPVQRNEEYYRQEDKEMQAHPDYLSIDNRNWFTGSQAHELHQTPNHACIFRNKQPFLTISNEEKRMGESNMQTICRGIAVADKENVYMAYVKTDENQKPLPPLTYHYKFNSKDAFKIEFITENAELLFMESYQ